MEIFIYIAIFVLFIMCGYIMYRHVLLERKVKEQDESHRKAIVNSGNAITDTLRVAFDNLKRNASDHNKINGKITEHNSRIHRLEQHISRTAKDFNQRKMADERIPFSNEMRGKNQNENDE